MITWRDQNNFDVMFGSLRGSNVASKFINIDFKIKETQVKSPSMHPRWCVAGVLKFSTSVTRIQCAGAVPREPRDEVRIPETFLG